MRYLSLLATALVLLPAVPSFSQNGESPRRKAVEVHSRKGLPNVLRKATAADGREIRVGYLGGSITAAEGWRVQSLAKLQELYPSVKWTQINAAIGGTGSDLGVFRVGAQVLAHQPDLLFVEFAVNDGATDPSQIQRCMEGIVRQTWAANPETDIVFVYTISAPHLADAQAGKCSRSADAMEAVADHYGIPSVDFGVDVARRITEGSLIFQGTRPEGKTANSPADSDHSKANPMIFSGDGVHPFLETGHVLYTEALFRAWDVIKAITPASKTPIKHERIAPLRSDNWEAAKIVPIRQKMLSGQWKNLSNTDDPTQKRFAERLPEIWRATTPGDSLTFRFRGHVIGFFDLLGPDSGQLLVSLDGDESKLTKRIDGYCTYQRLASFFPSRRLAPETVHTVTVTLDQDTPDKRQILFEKNRPDFDKNPQKYAPNLWNVGGILLLGEAVE